MNRKDIVINIVPIELCKSNYEVFVKPCMESDSGFKIRKDILPDGSVFECEKLSFSITEFADATKITASSEQIKLTKVFISHCLIKFLNSCGVFTSTGFIDEIACYEKSSEKPRNMEIELYKKFNLRVLAPNEQFATRRGKWCLSISYSGETEITKKTAKQLTILDRKIFSKILIGKEIKKTSWLTENEFLEGSFRPLMSRELRKRLNYSQNYYRTSNKYSKNYDESIRFYKTYVSGKELGYFSILEGGFQIVDDSQRFSTTDDSNLLLFGENRSHFSPYSGLKEYGPNKPLENSNYRFIFIFNEADKDYANRLYGYLTKGVKSYPGLLQFVGIQLVLDKEKSITFKEENPIAEIEHKLNSLNFDSGIKYLALYLSRVRKDELDDDKKSIYFNLKRMLLNKNISSQVIFRDNIENPYFNYFLPNISIAILAKLGGVPWRLSRPLKHDLVVGIGAFRNENQLFLGTTVAFKNDGTFARFDSKSVNSIDELIVFFKDVLNSAAKEFDDIKRLVIHYYKTMNSKEEKAIAKALSDLGLKLPYIVLNIITNSEIIPFDQDFSGKMPVSGTCIKLRKGHYILCNNSRYGKSTGAKIDDFPLPIQIKISKSSQSELSTDDEQLLIDQVYQFSRMYWVSVKQKGAPVTILYSEKVAEISSHFQNLGNIDSDVSKRSLWFL